MMQAKEVASGTFGKLWWDGEVIAECRKFSAKYTMNKEDVALCGQTMVDRKLMNVSGTGSVVIYVVANRWRDYANSVKEGVDKRATFIGDLNDPDSPSSANRVAIYGVSFDEVPLIDFEAGQIIQQEVPFTFMDHKFLNS